MKGYYDRCPECGGMLRQGVAEAETFPYKIGSFCIVKWTPKEQVGKLIPKGTLGCEPKGEGQYCPACKRVYAAFDVRF
jgi:uncharacterized protein with PIN domain